MNLKSFKLKSKFNKRYWGVALYLANSVNHCCSFNGGKVPVITSHSVIDKPEPVRRVMPPKIICTITMPTPTKSQIATGLEDDRSAGFIRRKVKAKTNDQP